MGEEQPSFAQLSQEQGQIAGPCPGCGFIERVPSSPCIHKVAPDLLAACEAVVAADDYLHSAPSNEHWEHHSLDKRRRAVALCRAAKAKAEAV
jgi:hypothetical protein